MNKFEILKQLTLLDFVAVDLQLYLDTHPNDEEIIVKYNEIIEAGDKLRAALEDNREPLFSFRSYSNNEYFNWIDNPYPWEKQFNIMLGEVCD